MKKWFLLVLITFLVVACDESEVIEPTDVDIESIDPSGQEIIYWYQHTRDRETAIKDLISDYNRTNRYNIKVRGEYAGSYKDIYNKMVVGIQADALPDISVAYQNQALAYFLDDAIIDISQYMNSKKWGFSVEERNDFVNSFLEQDFVDGIQIGFPPNRSIEVLYFNSDWLEELGFKQPPKTWEDFISVCRQARVQPYSKSVNKKRSLGFMIDPDASRFAALVFSRGGDIADRESKVYKFNTEEARKSLQMLRDLVVDGSAELLSEEYADQAEFAAGQLLFMLDSSSGLPFVDTAVQEGLGFKWSVSSPPFSGEDPIVNVYGASVSVCRSSPEKQLASWLFIKWLTAPTQQAKWVRASNYFPVRHSTSAELAKYLQENKQYAAAYSLLDYGKAEPTIANYEQVRRKIQQLMIQVIEGADPEVALMDLELIANKLSR